MINGIAQIALLVREYDEAKEFYCDKLGFIVVEDTLLPDGKRWVRLKSAGQLGSEILLSRAVTAQEASVIGNQAGGRVLFFLHTDNFLIDSSTLSSLGIEFTEGPFEHPYGTVAVFKDLYGNRIDLIQPKAKTSSM